MNPDKEIALIDYINKHKGVPFEFGVNDCPLFAFGALDIFAGTSYREDMTGKWSSKSTAWKYSEENGTIKDHLMEWGCVEVGENFKQTGDFILMDTGGDYSKGWRSVGIYLGNKAALMTVDGVEVVAMYRVPHIIGVVRYVP